LAKDLSGMTVNERLFDAELRDAYEAAKRNGELEDINVVLKKVRLQQDKDGMNWSINAQD
jgi:hypothetical protein